MKKKIFQFKFKNSDIIIFFINFLPWLLVIGSLYNLQIVKAKYYKSDIEKLSNKFETIHPKRGQIYVQDKNNNLYPVALSLRFYNVYFNPNTEGNIDEDIKTIEKIFPDIHSLYANENFASSSLKKTGKTILLKKDVNEELARIIKNLKLNSVFFEEYYKRIYPEKDFLATIVGFAANNDENFLEGKYGIENYYDETLKGKSGYRLDISKIEPPISGKNIVLNIDYFVQKEAEARLKETIQEFSAQGGMIVVSEPDGKIIALAENPSFDLNKFNEINNYEIFHTKFTQNYEPGSVMKTITYLTGIENNVFDENKVYYDAGYFEINGWKISNFDKKGRGEVTLGEAFEQSLNTGSIYLERLIGHNNFFASLRKFNFDKSPAVDLPYLTSGNLKNLTSNYVRDVNFATASFGHGISISPAHLLIAINSIAANGKMTNLSLLKNEKVIDFGNIIKSKSVDNIKNLMERVVLKGSGKKAKTIGFRIGGKTGSALVPKENQSGYSEDVLNTFVVIFPITNPKYTILVRVDKPNNLAGVTTVPAAKKMIDFLINYYNLQPDNNEELMKNF